MVDDRLWGKAKGLRRPYPLMGHMVDTAMVAGVLWDRLLDDGQRERISRALDLAEPEACRAVMLWAGLHDIGKAMPLFQDMARTEHAAHCRFLAEPQYEHDRSRDGQAEVVRHDFASSRALPHLLEGLGYPASGMAAFQLRCQIAQMLGGHHGRYPVGVEEDELEFANARLVELGGNGWARERHTHVGMLHELLGSPGAPQVEAIPVASAVVVTGLVIVADWLASQEHVVERQLAAWYGGGRPGSSDAVRAHGAAAARLAPRIVADAGLGRTAFRSRDFGVQFPAISKPHPLQRSIEQELRKGVEGPGILLVTAPTGEGKTEAALHAATVMGDAAGSRGLFFALPTQATANQMYDRVVDFARANLLDPAQITLAHGSADLYEGYRPAGRRHDEVDQHAFGSRVLSDHGDAPGATRADGVSVEASHWLRSRGRGLLAPISVGTIDQALMGVLPLRRNALRHLGLVGKTVVVDEAHAYDAFTHALLLRLLNWLGAMEVPVVLLSATLTGRTAASLVGQYLSGAGLKGASASVPAPRYPGWLYADGRTGRFLVPAEQVGTVRARSLDIDVRQVKHTYDAADADGRLAVILDESDKVAAEGGCAAVICTTVAEAQQTYDALRTHLTDRHGPRYTGWDDRASGTGEMQGDGTLLRLLHARFPAFRRADLTEEAERWYGRGDKPATRRPALPRGAILVATQIIEQSLDIDFDLVISDLAPVAQLLQRAGRAWRHDTTPRPDWATTPRIVVLSPSSEGKLSVPKSWGDVYSPSLLHRTEELLIQRQNTPVRVPEDVQELVDGVYEEEFTSRDPEQLMRRDLDRLGEEMAREGLARLVMIPPPAMADLHDLTTSDADSDLVATRLGTETVQLLPVYRDADGTPWLDEDCTVPFPERGTGREERFTLTEIRTLLRRVVPYAHGPWRAHCTKGNQPPAAWLAEPHLARLVLLPHQVTAGSVTGSALGDHHLRVDHSLGLTVWRE